MDDAKIQEIIGILKKSLNSEVIITNNSVKKENQSLEQMLKQLLIIFQINCLVPELSEILKSFVEKVYPMRRGIGTVERRLINRLKLVAISQSHNFDVGAPTSLKAKLKLAVIENDMITVEEIMEYCCNHGIGDEEVKKMFEHYWNPAPVAIEQCALG